MDVTVYLPDAIGKAAKEEGINLSGTLRDALEIELRRREAMRNHPNEPQVYEVLIEGEEGQYAGRITGREIDHVDDVSVFLTDDERVVIHDAGNLSVDVFIDQGQALETLDSWRFTAAYEALGVKPVVDL